MAFDLCPEDRVVFYLSWSLEKGQFTLRGYLRTRKKSGGRCPPGSLSEVYGFWIFSFQFVVFFLDWTYFSSLRFWKTLNWERKKKCILIQRTLNSYSQVLKFLFVLYLLFFFFLLVISNLTLISRVFDIYLSIFTIAALKSFWDNSNI